MYISFDGGDTVALQPSNGAMSFSVEHEVSHCVMLVKFKLISFTTILY